MFSRKFAKFTASQNIKTILMAWTLVFKYNVSKEIQKLNLVWKKYRLLLDNKLKPPMQKFSYFRNYNYYSEYKKYK